jgi:hypothetical protein
MNYGLIYWGNSLHSVEIFKVQKCIVRIITECRSRDSCRDLSKSKNFTSLLTIYTISSVFVLDNKNKFKSNSDVYHINTRQNCNMTNIYSTGIQAVNNLPLSMENLSDNAEQFKSGIKNYLYAYPFCCVEE